MINYKKQNDDDLVEILNPGEGIDVLLLSSPIKTRHSQRQNVLLLAIQTRHRNNCTIILENTFKVRVG